MNMLKTLCCRFSIPLFLLFNLNPLVADSCDPCEPCSHSFWGISAEARVAYYHPSSKKVKEIYGNGWADYQLELSKKFTGFGHLLDECGSSCLNHLDWSVFVGVSGFSQKGVSKGFYNDTKLQLVPISLGLKVFYPIFCQTKIFIGGAACYSFLHIHDDSDYVRKHTRKEAWGGLFQSGITYEYCEYIFVTAFFDYYFQRFDFHNIKSSSSDGSYDDNESRYIYRSNLNMNGYKVGVGLGLSF